MPYALLTSAIAGSDQQQDFVPRLFDMGLAVGVYISAFLFAVRLALLPGANPGYWSTCALLQGLGPIIAIAAAIPGGVYTGLPGSANLLPFGCAMAVCGVVMTGAGLGWKLLRRQRGAWADAPQPWRQRTTGGNTGEKTSR